MGRPLINGMDKLLIYPCVDFALPYCKIIHPLMITILSIIYKYNILMYFDKLNSDILCLYMLAERYYDCLDGEIARKYNKCSTLGHYMDKGSDFIYWNGICIRSLVFLYMNPTFTIYWWSFSLILMYVPFAILMDTKSNKHKLLGTISEDSWFIYLEDNGGLFAFMLPYFIDKIR